MDKFVEANKSVAGWMEPKPVEPGSLFAPHQHKSVAPKPVARSSLSAPYQPGADWYYAHDNAIPFPPARSGRGFKGPRSLISTCIRVLAENIVGAPNPGELLSDLPEHLQRPLWKELYARNMSLGHWWNLSSPLIPKPPGPASNHAISRKGKEKEVQAVSGKGKGKEVRFPMGLIRYAHDVGCPTCKLDVYLAPLMDWKEGLIYICIDNVGRFETHEMIPLATLPQLAVLEIIERQRDEGSRIDDRLIRAWSEVPGVSFPSLRVLKFVSRGHRVTPSALQYVLPLPRLEILDITAVKECPLRTSNETKDIVNHFGWKITEPIITEARQSLFVAYTEAYLEREVHRAGVMGLKWLFENDKQPAVWADNPRLPRYREWEESREMADEKEKAEDDAGHVEPGPEQPDGPDLRDYLDDGWRAVLQGTHELSGAARPQTIYGTGRHEMTVDQIFWFLALLDQRQVGKAKQTAMQKQVEGVTLPGDQFVSLTLCAPAYGHCYHRLDLCVSRLIFSRRRDGAVAPSGAPSGSSTEIPPHLKRSEPEAEQGPGPGPAPSWAPRSDDRKETNLEPGKRQKRSTGDLLSSFGVPQGKPE